mmetsp:Transcript_19563/g.49742  ORF Transcript_19563/g.49742 Transcript_19563/m.49742 type:complete len:489 (-) Transcript_19563:155-1621(-)
MSLHATQPQNLNSLYMAHWPQSLHGRYQHLTCPCLHAEAAQWVSTQQAVAIPAKHLQESNQSGAVLDPGQTWLCRHGTSPPRVPVKVVQAITDDAVLARVLPNALLGRVLLIILEPWPEALRRQLVHLHRGAVLQAAQALHDVAPDAVNVQPRVVVLHRLVARHVEREVGRVVLVVRVARQLLRHRRLRQDGRLVRPAARHVGLDVAAAARDQHGHAKLLHEAQRLAVPAQRHVEAAQPVVGQRVGATLHDNGPRLEHLHDLAHDGPEQRQEGVVGGAVLERHVDRVVLAVELAAVAQRAGAREEVVAVLVEGHGHDAVAHVERLLHAVAMVHVDVDVQHARVVAQQLQDGQHQVVHVAEARRLPLLGVVQPARPVDGDVGQPVVELLRALQRRARVQLAEVEHAVKHGAVLVEVVARQLLAQRGRVVGRHARQELHVVCRVELSQLRWVGLARPKDLHIVVQTITKHKMMCHGQSVRLHGVILPKIE